MKSLKQFQKKQLAAAVLVGLFTLTGNVLAAQGSGSGGSGNGSGSGSGGSGGGGAGTGEIFGDLYKLLRDPNGVPILTAENCQQPIAAPDVALVNTLDGTTACTPTKAGESCVIPVDPTTCAVVAGYETYLQAVDFARMSVARSPESVMEKQLADVLVNLSTAECLTLDPAGRLVYSNPDTADVDGDGDTAELVSSAVDSPLQNLSIYRELIMKGSLGNPAITLPKPFNSYSMLDTAAKSLGAASDKGGKIDIDLVVYLNQIMGLDKASTALGDNICITTRQEVQGKVQDVEKCFLDYRSYQYQRATTYGNLPYPANIPADEPELGSFDYLTLYEASTTADGAPLFFIDSASIYPTVFSGLPGFTGGNIGGFAQASDDARAVIEFMHSHPVLEGFEAPVVCQAAPPPAPPVDVSSKLQMPIRMVGNTTREGTLTVVNLKGATANGSVQLKGVDSRNTQIFSNSYSFSGLAAGQSKSFTIVFKGPSYATTINWTAIATAAGDTNDTNNTATAKTVVMAPRGSGGGEGE